MGNAKKNLTILLNESSKGNESARAELWPTVYAELHKLAERYMRKENSGHTLQPTALIHEAFIRLLEGKGVDYQDRSHFFAVAAQVMRRIMVDHAKAKNADKRGGGGAKIPFDEKIHVSESSPSPDLLILDGALDRLKEMDPSLATLVELRYFGGLSIEQTAEVMGLSPATVKRHWSTAKLWLYREINQQKS